jgi:hypothetical protein
MATKNVPARTKTAKAKAKSNTPDKYRLLNQLIRHQQKMLNGTAKGNEFVNPKTATPEDRLRWQGMVDGWKHYKLLSQYADRRSKAAMA